MLILFLASVFLTSLAFSYLIIYFLTFNKRAQLKKRLASHLPQGETLFKKPLLTRLLKPIIHWIGQQLEKMTPKKYRQHLESLLLNLGHQYRVQDVLMIKVILAVMMILVFTFYLLLITVPNLLFVSLIVLGAFFLPDLLLAKGLKKKREEMLVELPTFIELLTIILESGISFDNALQKITQRKKGPLVNEFKNFLQDLRMGSSKEEAFHKIAKRIQLKEFDSLARAIIQGERMGISILQTLRVQSKQIRSKQSQRYKEQALQIPVKLLFPLVFFIFPPILIVILGPALIHIFETLL